MNSFLKAKGGKKTQREKGREREPETGIHSERKFGIILSLIQLQSQQQKNENADNKKETDKNAGKFAGTGCDYWAR